MKVKRFVVFWIESYYPSGGMNDYKDSFDTMEEAIAYDKANDGGHDIVDLENFTPDA